MKPFPDKFDFESQAYGLHYAIQIKSASDDWLALCFIRIPLGHQLYNKEMLDLSQDSPDADIFHQEFGVTPDGREDRNSWWIGFSFSPNDFGEVIAETENIMGQLVGDHMDTKQGGATVGGPAYELL